MATDEANELWRDPELRRRWFDVDEETGLHRRFFDIGELAGVRVEDPEVFELTHRVVLRLVSEGLVDGLRVDHPDGLADPRGYLGDLAKATGGAWVVTEKILTGPADLPPDRKGAGTTGHAALGRADGPFLGPAGAGPLAAGQAQV